MQKRSFSILVILLLWGNLAWTQQYINYTTKDGLPSNHIYRITQDSKGFMWFITDKGMSKFDGKIFKNFTTKEGLPTNDIWDIRTTPDGKVWFFSKASQLGYIKNDSVFSFKSIDKNDILYPIGILQYKNEVGFSNGQNAYFLEDSKWIKQKQTKDKDHYGELIIHPFIKEIIINDKYGTLELINHEHKLEKTFKKLGAINENLYRTQINDSLYIWINDTEFTLLNLNSLQIQSHTFNGMKSKFIRVSNVNDKIQLSGVGFVSNLTKKYSLDSIIKIPPYLQDHFSFLDKNNNLWVATFGKGVFFLPHSKRNATYRLNNKKIGKLQRIQDNLIANVYNEGFYKYNSITKDFDPFIKEKGFIFNAIRIDSLQTNYYITNKKIFIEKNGKQSVLQLFSPQKKYELGNNLVYFQGFLYGNTSFGVNKIDPKNLKSLREYRQNGVRDILKFRDRILLATANGLKTLKNNNIENIQFVDTLFDKPIVKIKKLNNRELLLCTDGFGAYITDLHKITLLKQSNYLTVQNAFIQNNSIWLATNNGIWHYAKEDTTYELKRKYSTADGLIYNNCNAVNIVKNDLIVSSDNGISIIPINLQKSNTLLRLYLDNIHYNNTTITEKKPVYYTSNNHLDITINAIDFSIPNSTYNFQYKLSPIQKKWTQTASKTLNFSNVLPGKYQLKVKANTISTNYAFEILPLWWQRPITKVLFTLLSLSLIILLLYFLRERELTKKTTKIHTQKKIAENELYALRSQMNPHFVFNSLNAIQYYLTNNEIDLSEKYLVKFSKLIRMFFDFSRYDEISIQEEIQLLEGYLEIEKLRFGEKFTYSIEIDHTLNLDQHIPAMLLQPIVENAVNHGIFHKQGDGFIHVLFKKLAPSQFQVQIKDNGIGRIKSGEIKKRSLRKHQSKSTEILHERIHLLNQSKRWQITYHISDLDSTNNQGTKVSLLFKQL